jgi:hypothetical protein
MSDTNDDTIAGYKHPNGGGGGRIRPYDSQRAVEANRTRWSKVRESAISGALAGMESVSADIPSDLPAEQAVTHGLARIQGEHAMEGSTPAATWIMKAIGAGGFSQQQQEQQHQGVTLSISTESLLALAQRLGALPDGDALEHESESVLRLSGSADEQHAGVRSRQRAATE